MTTLIFATNNQNKVKEIRAVLQNGFEIITLKEAGIDIDIPEPHDTLSANATEKSTVIHRLTGKNCFSEDSGLEVAVLNGEPGVRSARYAGEDNNFQNNVHKLLKNMENVEDRSAQFRTVISLLLDDEEYQFEGICKGHITRQQQGAGGFGYDPVFIPEGSTKTFAEMTMDEKNLYSHRKKATAQLIHFLNDHHGEDKS
jgi:XTP/dITP diphosphohydrolase